MSLRSIYSFGRRITAFASLLLLLAAPGLHAQNDSERQRARALSSAFEALAATIPGALYDVDALAESLDYKVDSAAAFVREQIAYDPYAGVMRGPEGTISAEAGSVWDQAVLTAALVNAMGGEALIVRGILPPADSQRLLRQSLKNRPVFGWPFSPRDIHAAFGDLLPGASAPVSNEEFERVVAAISFDDSSAGALSDTLWKTAGPLLRESAGTDSAYLQAIRKEVSENYAWVRYRDTPNDPWMDSHPAFGDAPAPAVQPTSFVADSVPEDRLHRIEIRLEIERRENGRFVREPIMEPYVRPAANLWPVQLPLSIAPSTPPGPDREAKLFQPLLFGGHPAGARAFDLSGRTYDADLVMSGPGVFAEVSNLFGVAAGELDPGVQSRLTGVLMTVVVHAPGREPRTHERRLIDLRDASDNAAARLMLSGVLAVDLGASNGGRRFKSILQRLADAMVLSRVFHQVDTGGEGIALDEVPRVELPDPAWTDFQFFADALYAHESGGVLIRPRPFIAMKLDAFDFGDASVVSTYIDIIENESLVLRQEGESLLVDRHGALQRGVEDTLFEALLNGAELDAGPWQQGKTLLLNSAPEAQQWAQDSGLGRLATERVLQDADAGHALIASAATSSDEPAWWRIDRETGSALLMRPYGGGSPLTEEAIVDGVLFAISTLAYGYSMKSCHDTYPNNNDPMRWCCAAGATMLYVGGTAMAGSFSSAPYGKGVFGPHQGPLFGNGAWKAALGQLGGGLAFEGQMWALGKGAGFACSEAFER